MELKLTNREQELRRWIEAEGSKYNKLFWFPLKVAVADDPEFLNIYLDYPIPEKLFCISRVVIKDSYMEIVKKLSSKMLSRYIQSCEGIFREQPSQARNSPRHQ